MDDTKQSGEQQHPKPIGESVTDIAATVAGALAEGAVRAVAKRVRKAAVKKTPA